MKLAALSRRAVLPLGLALVLAPGLSRAATPTNDMFASAIMLTGISGSITNSNAGGTSEPGEPSHAGFAPIASIWYKWVAPVSGEMSLDTIGSVVSNAMPLDTVLAVYVGSDVAHLTQVAANDNIYPPRLNSLITQVDSFASSFRVPYAGPSGLRFNATAGTTYYFAVDTKTGTGALALSWALNSAGVFRFATEDFSTGMPTFQCAETEGLNAAAYYTYYAFGVPGVLINVTRVGGSSGRMLVDYFTADPPTNVFKMSDTNAISGRDYLGGQGTLVFDNFEMTKSFYIPVFGSFSAAPNRLFTVGLTNARPAVAESPLVSAPRIDPSFGSAIVRILDMDLDPRWENNFQVQTNADTNVPPTAVFATTTNVVFNFSMKVLRMPRDVNDFWADMDILVMRRGTNQDGATLNYRINNYAGSDSDLAEEANNIFPLQPGSDYATPTPPNTDSGLKGLTPDFDLAQGTVTFGQNDNLPKRIHVVFTNDASVKFNKDLVVTLYLIVDGRPKLVGQVNECTVTELADNDYAPAGSVDQLYNPDHTDGMRFRIPIAAPNIDRPGADGPVYDLAVIPGDQTVIAGQFSSYNGTTRNGIARLNLDGTLDPAFDPGTGLGDPYNDFIASLAVTANGQYVVGGDFNFFGDGPAGNIARVNANGSLDTVFAQNLGQGADNAVWVVAMQTNAVLVGGAFTTIDGSPRPYLARLDSLGHLDTTFVPDVPNGQVRTLAVDAAGRILIGGDFTTVGGVARSHIARLTPNGQLDATFNPGSGTDGTVFRIAFHPDGRIFIGGDFTRYNLVSRPRLALLTATGALDLTFDPGTGADAVVYSITPQADGTLYVGGAFSSFNGTHRLGFARLYSDGTVDTTFLDTAYSQFAGLHRLYFDKQTAGDPRPYVRAAHVQSDGNILIAGAFSRVGGGQADAAVRADPEYPTNIYNTAVWLELKGRDGYRNRNNIARLLGGATPGPGSLNLVASSYSVNKSQSYLAVTLVRTNGTLGYASANFAVKPGLAQSGTDYTYYGTPPLYLSSWRPGLVSSEPNATTRAHEDGLLGGNTLPQDLRGVTWYGYLPSRVQISLLPNSNSGNRDSVLTLANPANADQFFLGGANMPLGVALGRSMAPFIIIDDSRRTNFLGFATATFTVNELATNAIITVVRTNGTAGSPTVQFSTVGGTAVPGVNYIPTNGTLNFGPGVTNLSFAVPILDDSVSAPIGLTVQLQLSSVQGAVLGLANAVLTIIDNDYAPGYVTFSAAAYGTNVSSGAAVLTVMRNGANKGLLTVQYATTNGTAVSGVQYRGSTNTLSWDNGDSSPQYITVPLINSGQVGPNTSFGARLYNPVVNLTNAPMVLGGTPIAATVTITNNNYYGALQFSAPTYLVNENGGVATLTVNRLAGVAQSLSVNYATADGSAVSTGTRPNFGARSGTLTFAPGEISKSFDVPLIDDGTTNPPPASFFFTVGLSGLTPPGAAYGTPTNAVVYIRDASTFNAPAGSVDTAFNTVPGFDGDIYSVALQANGQILAAGSFSTVNGYARNSVARVNADSTLDTAFLDGMAGANGPVNKLIVQSDGRILIGGGFTTVNGLNRSRVGRLQADGTADTAFTPGVGADNTVFALAESFVGGDRRLLVGGSFVTYNNVPHPGVVRLTGDGLVDGSFGSALTINGTVYAIAVYPANVPNAGNILIGGDFTAINGASRFRIARLLPDGTVDATFNAGAGASDAVRALAIQQDGKIVVGGAFTNFNGVALSRVARLNADGSVDGSFNVGLGTDDTVSDIAIQPDNRIVLVGQFTHASGVSRSRITRLLADGTVDPNINFGLGADNFISSVALQPDGNLVVGGGFTQFDGAARQKLARLYGGSITGSGRIEFAAGDFQADENSTNAVITVRRRGGTTGNVSVLFQTANFTGPNAAVAGVNYSNVSATLMFPVGETVQTVSVPVYDDLQISPDLVASLVLTNLQSPAGYGNQPTATLTILNDNCAISFGSTAYRVNEDAFGQVADISVVRQGSVRLPASVEFFTTTNGTAVAYTNYVPVTNTLVVFQPGQSNATVTVPVLATRGVVEGDVFVTMQLSNANHALLYTPYQAALTIVDVDVAPGNFLLAQTNIVVGEADGYALVTVLRTNGSSGLVSVNFNTLPGTGLDAALPGVKYVATNGVLNFLPGETMKTIPIAIINENQVEGNQGFSLSLYNPQGGAAIMGSTNVPITILDDDTGVSFSSPVYIASETAGSVTLAVERVGTNGTTTVGYVTTNATAAAGTNYLPAAGTLTFAPGEFLKTFQVSLLHDPRVTGDLGFYVNLVNLSGSAQYGANPVAFVDILDADPGLSFTNANFYTAKSATNVLITVTRSNANTGLVLVNYTTVDGTALAGTDYQARNGLLIFSNGVTLQSFSVPIINNRQVGGDKQFSVSLFNPSAPAQLVVPSTASITITNDVSGLSLSSPVYTVNENGVSAPITVLRSGYTNNTVSVNFSTADGTGKAGVNYIATSGGFVFTNGEVSKTFSIPVIDNSVPDGDKTVLINLSNVVGNAVLLNPSAATLTMVESDGSVIVPAGTAMVYESGPTNGMIDPGETVRLLFGLRSTAGTNTANLMATLLPTGGVTNPSSPQNYGALVVRGPSVSREFSFTANATNGQVIQATFRLTDGNAPTNQTVFNFVVGRTSQTFANPTPIIINDATNATPYPSVITVSGVPGSVSKATVTLTNLSHTWPSDIDALLVSPSGADTLLMAKAGASYPVSGVTLTFDDAAANYLPASSVIVSGTNQPTSYAPVAPPFAAPAPTGPYTARLSDFSGSNPNGPWSLYIIDDSPHNSGSISNGWILNLTSSTPILGDADLGVTMSAAPATVIDNSNVTYSVTLRNYGPAAATNIVVTDLIPAGAAYLSSAPSTGITSNNLGAFTWRVPALAKDASATLTLVLQTTALGSLTNTMTVASAVADPNPDDDSASGVVEVVAPTADLAIGLVDLPNPVLLGSDITYAISVTNLGPGTAINLSVTDTLPPGVSLVSASAGYVLSGSVVAFPNLGNLGSGATTSLTIVARPTMAGTVTNVVTCVSDAVDPLKLNNTASAKTMVEALQLGFQKSGSSLTISWTAMAPNFGLEYATDLTPPVVWTPLTNPPPTTGGGQKSVTVPIGSGNQFFRLRSLTP